MAGKRPGPKPAHEFTREELESLIVRAETGQGMTLNGAKRELVRRVMDACSRSKDTSVGQTKDPSLRKTLDRRFAANSFALDEFRERFRSARDQVRRELADGDDEFERQAQAAAETFRAIIASLPAEASHARREPAPTPAERREAIIEGAADRLRLIAARNGRLVDTDLEWACRWAALAYRNHNAPIRDGARVRRASKQAVPELQRSKESFRSAIEAKWDDWLPDIPKPIG